MKSFKKLWIVLLTAALIFTGCSNKKTKGREEFDAYLDLILKEIIEEDDFDINYLFLNPSEYGIETGVYELPFTSLEEALEVDKFYKDVRKELGTFNYKKLSDSQKITYDVLQDAFSKGLDTEKYYYISTNYLGSFLGYQAQLPLLLMEYTFNNEKDILSYFNVLETMEKTFVEYSDLEKARQENKTGMSQVIIDKVIEQCDNITKEEKSFLVDIINDKIDATTFLDDTKKQEYKEKSERLLANEYMQAYRRLGEELGTITSTIEDGGLVTLPNGKKYYEHLVKSSTGTSMTVEEVRTFANEHYEKYLNEFIELVTQNPSLYDEIMALDFENITYTNRDNFEDVLNDLGERMLEDYPDIGELRYEVTKVPEAMKDNFSPAAYLTGKIDAPLDYPERIFINGEFSQSLFTTLAHEGYPGHMYQNSFFRQTNPHPLRMVFGYGAYTEGWATYVENSTWKYADTESEQEALLLKAVQLNSQVSEMLNILMDIGVHYDGWTREDLKAFVIKNFGDQGDETVYDQQYDIILETPANSLKYYVGGTIFEDLYQKAEKELGSKFDVVEFNRVLLNCGPSPFSVVEKEVDAYIKKNK